MPEAETAVAITEPRTLTAPAEPHNFISDFKDCYKLANVLSTAEIIPEKYRGKPADCAIAIDMANRMNVSPIMVMQNLYVVKGKPSWSGSACMAFLRNRYKSVIPVYTGERGSNSRGCYIKATDSDGNTLEGTEITMQMASAEGWTSNSKWKNMPEQMLAYRAASFFARIYCPEVLMGVPAEEEICDIEPREVEDVL